MYLLEGLRPGGYNYINSLTAPGAYMMPQDKMDRLLPFWCKKLRSLGRSQECTKQKLYETLLKVVPHIARKFKAKLGQ